MTSSEAYASSSNLHFDEKSKNVTYLFKNVDHIQAKAQSHDVNKNGLDTGQNQAVEAMCAMQLIVE